MVKMEAFDDSHFMHQAVRVGHTDHTGSIVFPMACIFDLKKKFLCNWTLIKIVLYRRAIAGLGMVKLEAFDDPHFMHQTVRGGHTDHTGSIVFPMACIFDLKKKFLCNWTLIKIVLYRRAIASLGMVKLEAFDDPHFMHQTVRGGHTDHTGSIVSLMACIFDLKKKFLCNWTLVLL